MLVSSLGSAVEPSAPARTPAEAKLALDPWFTFPKPLVRLIRTGKITGAVWVRTLVGTQTDSVKVRLTTPQMAMDVYALVSLWIAMHRRGSILPDITDQNYKAQQANCRPTQARAIEAFERLLARQGMPEEEIADRVAGLKECVRANMPIIPSPQVRGPELVINSVFAGLLSAHHTCQGDRLKAVEEHRKLWGQYTLTAPAVLTFGARLKTGANRTFVVLERGDRDALADFQEVVARLCKLYHGTVAGYAKSADPNKRKLAYLNAARAAFFSQRKALIGAVAAFTAWTDPANAGRVQVAAPRTPVYGKGFVSERQIGYLTISGQEMGRLHLFLGESYGLDIEATLGPDDTFAALGGKFDGPPVTIVPDWIESSKRTHLEALWKYQPPKRRRLFGAGGALAEASSLSAADQLAAKLVPGKPFVPFEWNAPPEPDFQPPEMHQGHVAKWGIPLGLMGMYDLPPLRRLPGSLAELAAEDAGKMGLTDG